MGDANYRAKSLSAGTFLSHNEAATREKQQPPSPQPLSLQDITVDVSSLSFGYAATPATGSGAASSANHPPAAAAVATMQKRAAPTASGETPPAAASAATISSSSSSSSPMRTSSTKKRMMSAIHSHVMSAGGSFLQQQQQHDRSSAVAAEQDHQYSKDPSVRVSQQQPAKAEEDEEGFLQNLVRRISSPQSPLTLSMPRFSFNISNLEIQVALLDGLQTRIEMPLLEELLGPSAASVEERPDQMTMLSGKVPTEFQSPLTIPVKGADGGSLAYWKLLNKFSVTYDTQIRIYPAKELKRHGTQTSGGGAKSKLDKGSDSKKNRRSSKAPEEKGLPLAPIEKPLARAISASGEAR